MALARSMSGPGGLSINTSSANSLFGSTTTPAAGGGMFGSAQASKPATGLFGATTTSSAPQTGGLFGSTATTTQGGGLFGSSTATTQAQTGGLFGSTTTTTQPQTGGLFGSTQPQPQQTGGLFGSTNTSQPAQTGGLFGSTMNSQPQQTSGLFSNLGQSAPQNATSGLFGTNTSQPAQGGGLFGGLNTQNQNKPATGLFGSLGSTQQPQQNQPQQSSMFSSLGQGQNNQGASLSQNQGSALFGRPLGGGLTLGQTNSQQQQQQQQQTVPGVTIDMTNIRNTTRFSDLHPDIKKDIENIDTVIQQQIQMRNQCQAIMEPHESHLAQIPHDVEFCHRKVIAVQNARAVDVQSITLAKKYIDSDIQHAKLSFKAIENLKLPAQFHTSGIWSTKTSSNNNQSGNGEGGSQDMVAYFSGTAEELAATLASYQKHIVEIEQHLRGVEGSSAAQLNALIAKRNGSLAGIEDPMEQLTGALRDFEESLLGVAANVGAAREGIQSLQLGRFDAPGGVKKGPRTGVY